MQKNVSWQSKENKLSLPGKTDGKERLHKLQLSVLGVLSVAVMNSWHMFLKTFKSEEKMFS